MTSRKRSLDVEETSCLRSTKKLKADTSFFNVPTSFGIPIMPIHCPNPCTEICLFPPTSTPSEPITSLTLDAFHRGTHQQPHQRNLPISNWDFDGDELNVRGYRRQASPDGSESDTPSSDSETPELVYDTNWDQSRFDSETESLNMFYSEPARYAFSESLGPLRGPYASLHELYSPHSVRRLDPRTHILNPNTTYDEIISFIEIHSASLEIMESGIDWKGKVINEYARLNRDIGATFESMVQYKEDMQLVQSQTNVSEQRALDALDLCKRDLVNTLMMLYN